MPLHSVKYVSHESVIGIWHITEDESYFKRKIDLFPEESEFLKAVKSETKRREWLAARWLLQKLDQQDERIECRKDEHGKPYLLGSELHISMSHSHEYTAVILSPRLCGIDIQKEVGKIVRIAHKFCSPAELAAIEDGEEIADLHLYWGAKESIYKAYGKRQVDFRKHMQVSLPDKYSQLPGHGLFLNDHLQLNFEIYCETMEDYYIVYTIQKED